jgi:hypothetical protein
MSTKSDNAELGSESAFIHLDIALEAPQRGSLKLIYTDARLLPAGLTLGYRHKSYAGSKRAVVRRAPLSLPFIIRVLKPSTCMNRLGISARLPHFKLRDLLKGGH